jgi:hypothetical protein
MKNTIYNYWRERGHVDDKNKFLCFFGFHKWIQFTSGPHAPKKHTYYYCRHCGIEKWY